MGMIVPLLPNKWVKLKRITRDSMNFNEQLDAQVHANNVWSMMSSEEQDYALWLLHKENRMSLEEYDYTGIPEMVLDKDYKPSATPVDDSIEREVKEILDRFGVGTKERM